MADDTRIMYAITHVNRDGMRTLTMANQGRNHYATEEQAQKALAAFRPGLRSVIGEAVETLEVRPVECWSHGDAKGIWFD